MPNMPALGIRFNINNVGSGFYGIECWKVFWRAVDIQKLSGALLFDGDTDATLDRREYVYCITVQCNHQRVLDNIKVSLEKSTEFHKIAASPEFVQNNHVVGEPLVFSGEVDSNGNITGVTSLPHMALDAVKKEQQRSAQISQPTKSSSAVKGQSTTQNKEKQQEELCRQREEERKVKEEFEIKKLEEARKVQEENSIIKPPSEQKVPPEKSLSPPTAKKLGSCFGKDIIIPGLIFGILIIFPINFLFMPVFISLFGGDYTRVNNWETLTFSVILGVGVLMLLKKSEKTSSSSSTSSKKSNSVNESIQTSKDKTDDKTDIKGNIDQKERKFVTQNKSKTVDKNGDIDIFSLANSKSWEARRDVAISLGKKGEVDAVEPLINALKNDREWVVRFCAAEALGKIGDERAIIPLTNALYDEDILEHAANSLANFGSLGVEPLLNALKSSKWNIRSYSAEALGKTKDRRAVEPLLKSLGDEVIAVRRSSARSLGVLGDSRAINPLKSALVNADEYSRSDIAEALKKLNWEPTDDLKVKYFIGLSQWDKCVEIGASAVETIINIYYNEKDYSFANENRWKAKKALIEIGSPAVEPLISKLKDSNDEIKKLIADILRQINDPRTEASSNEFLREKQTVINDSKKALIEYWKINAKVWWRNNLPKNPVCDSCMAPLVFEDSYYKGGWMCCKSCVEDSLQRWNEGDNDVNYFGVGEVEKALEHYQIHR